MCGDDQRQETKGPDAASKHDEPDFGHEAQSDRCLHAVCVRRYRQGVVDPTAKRKDCAFTSTFTATLGNTIHTYMVAARGGKVLKLVNTAEFCPSSRSRQEMSQIKVGKEPAKVAALGAFCSDKELTLKAVDAVFGKWVVPVRVHGAVDFNLPAIWACPVGTKRADNYIGEIHRCLVEHRGWLSRQPTLWFRHIKPCLDRRSNF